MPHVLLSWRLPREVRSLIKPRNEMMFFGFILIVVSRAVSILPPILTKHFVDDVIGKRDTGQLTITVAGVVMCLGIQGLTSFLSLQILAGLGHRMIADLRVAVQSHVARLPLSYYDKHQVGSLLSRVMNDIGGAGNALGPGLIQFASNILAIVLMFGALLYLNAQMTMFVFIALVFFGIAFHRGLRKLHLTYHEYAATNARVSGMLAEYLSGIRVIKAYCGETTHIHAFRSGVEGLCRTSVNQVRARGLMSLSSTLLASIILGSLLRIGASQILAGKMSVGSFLSYLLFLGMLLGPVSSIVELAPLITEGFTGLQRTSELLTEKPEEDAKRVVHISRVSGDIAFDNVQFSYDQKQAVLKGVTFTAEPGTVTALVGCSGAGKSTIISLLAGFHSPTAGRILIDSLDLTTVCLVDYRSQLGIVLQDPFLFSGTIWDNVSFARPDALKDDILTACCRAGVSEFVEALEKKYETHIGERGVTLSGGQKQRICIARAFLANPRILLLDEATSSLDIESQTMVQDALQSLMQGRTTFVISHRLSTIQQADQILVLEEGRIIERGTHQFLFASQGRYFDLYSKEYGRETPIA